MPKQMKIIIRVSWKPLTIIRLRQVIWEKFMFFEILRIDGFSTDRIIYDKIANIEAIESKLINFSKEFSMKYLLEQKRNIGNASLDVLLIDILLPNIVKIASSWMNPSIIFSLKYSKCSPTWYS